MYRNIQCMLSQLLLLMGEFTKVEKELRENEVSERASKEGPQLIIFCMTWP